MAVNTNKLTINKQLSPLLYGNIPKFPFENHLYFVYKTHNRKDYSRGSFGRFLILCEKT